MGTKFYHAENATRVFQVNGQEVLFKPYRYFGGTWSGVYATDDENIQAGLDHMARIKTNAIRELTKQDYDAKEASLPSHLRETYNPVDKNTVKVIAAPVTPTKSGQKAIVESDPEAKQDVRNPEEPQAEGQPVSEASEALNVGTITPAAEPIKTVKATPKPGKPKQSQSQLP